MSDENEQQKIIIDDVEYAADGISETAKSQLESIKFVDSRIQQLNNEWAIADTARIGYTNALKAEIAKLENSE